MAARGVSGLGVGLVATGAVLIYSGLENQAVSQILQDLIHGQKPQPGPAGNYVASNGATGTTGTTGGSANIPPPAAAHGSAAAHQAIARLLAGPYGWSAGKQWDALVALWNRESGWSNTAFNASGAYGIAQALGHAGPGESAVGPRSVGSTTPGVNNAYGGWGLTSAEARLANAGYSLPQIQWGLSYIHQAYGSPEAAWANELSKGSY